VACERSTETPILTAESNVGMHNITTEAMDLAEVQQRAIAESCRAATKDPAEDKPFGKHEMA